MSLSRTLLMPAVREIDSSADPLHVGRTWIGAPLKFHIAQTEPMLIQGYQLYAVEKWIVERTSPVQTLVVYTGDPQHKITVTPLIPAPSLDPDEAHRQFVSAFTLLRRHGARPKETPYGTLLVTSLARFPSDHTIVLIPGGSLPPVRPLLYTNINLLRMGCSGRSAVTLEQSSDSTKDRFMALYHLPEFIAAPPSPTSTPAPSSPTLTHTPPHIPANTTPGAGTPVAPASPPSSPSAPRTHKPQRAHRSPALFASAVLELVRLLQAALAMFGMFPLDGAPGGEPWDGLLCDGMMKGLQTWREEIGSWAVGLEPSDPPTEPSNVAALLSLVLATRNKLAAVCPSHIHVLKDPFLRPAEFVASLAQWHASTTAVSSHYHSYSQSFTHSQSHSVSSAFGQMGGGGQGPGSQVWVGVPGVSPSVMSTPAQGHTTPSHLSLAPSLTLSVSTRSSSPPLFDSSVSSAGGPVASKVQALTRPLLDALTAAYDRRSRADGARKLPRVLLSKLDDLTDGVVRDRERDREREDEKEAERDPDDLFYSDPDPADDSGGHTNTTAGGAGGGGRLPGLASISSLGAHVGTRMSKAAATSLSMGLAGVGGRAGRGDGGKGDAAAAAFVVPTRDLAAFVRAVVGKERKGRRRGSGGIKDKDKEKERESYRDSPVLREQERLFAKDTSKDKDRDWDIRDRDKDKDKDREKDRDTPVRGVAASIRALWSGRIGALARMREREAERRSHLLSFTTTTASLAVTGYGHGHAFTPDTFPSDGDAVDFSDEDMSGGGGGPGAGRAWVQKKIGAWAGLSRRKPPSGHAHTVSGASSLGPMSGVGSAEGTDGATGTTLQSLHASEATVGRGGMGPPSPLPHSAGEEVLSSGQVSPISESRTSMLAPTLGLTLPRVRSATNMRPGASRVSSWADPLSAQDDVDALGRVVRSRAARRATTEAAEERGKARTKDSVKAEDTDASEKRRKGEGAIQAGRMWRVVERTQDMDWLRDAPILDLDRMRIDVDLCGQLLIMQRRAAHLANVIAVLEVLNSALSATNAALRTDHAATQAALSALGARSALLSAVEADARHADAATQEARALRYEAAQLDMPALAAAAGPPRRAVLALRERVFGLGAPPQRDDGAHARARGHGRGRFNRVQWRLDGSMRRVDAGGRTESEAEEEEALGAGADLAEDEGTGEQEARADAGAAGKTAGNLPVLEAGDGDGQGKGEGGGEQQQSVKPVWLLRLFTDWGTAWGVLPRREPSKDRTVPPSDGEPEAPAASTSSGPVSRSTSSSSKESSPQESTSEADAAMERNT